MTKMSRGLYRSESSGAQRKKQCRLKQTFILITTVLNFLLELGQHSQYSDTAGWK